jgi:hypothetical protein
MLMHAEGAAVLGAAENHGFPFRRVFSGWKINVAWTEDREVSFGVAREPRMTSTVSAASILTSGSQGTPAFRCAAER